MLLHYSYLVLYYNSVLEQQWSQISLSLEGRFSIIEPSCFCNRQDMRGEERLNERHIIQRSAPLRCQLLRGLGIIIRRNQYNVELRIFYRDRRISSSSRLEIMNFLRLLVKLLVKTQIFQKLSPKSSEYLLPKIVERASWKTVKRRIFMMNQRERGGMVI